MHGAPHSAPLAAHSPLETPRELIMDMASSARDSTKTEGTMWVWKLIKGIGRLLVDFIYLILGVIVTAIIFNAVGIIPAFLIALPVWLGLSFVYKLIFGPRTPLGSAAPA